MLRSRDFNLNVVGSYRMILHKEIAVLDSPLEMAQGRRTGSEETNSESSAPGAKLHYEFNEELLSKQRQGER